MQESRPRLRRLCFRSSRESSVCVSSKRHTRHRSHSRRFSLPRPAPPDPQPVAAPSSAHSPTEDDLWLAAEAWIAKQVLVTFRHRAIISQLRPVYAGVKSIDPGDLMLQIILPPKVHKCPPRVCSAVSAGEYCAVTDHEPSVVHMSVDDDDCKSLDLHSAGRKEMTPSDGSKSNGNHDRPRDTMSPVTVCIYEPPLCQEHEDAEMSSVEELKLHVRERLAHFDAMQNIVKPEVAVRRWNQPSKIWTHRPPFRKLNGSEFDRGLFSQCSQPGSDSVTL